MMTGRTVRIGVISGGFGFQHLQGCCVTEAGDLK